MQGKDDERVDENVALLVHLALLVRVAVAVALAVDVDVDVDVLRLTPREPGAAIAL